MKIVKLLPILLFSVFSQNLSACNCHENISLEDEVHSTDILFWGKVEKITTVFFEDEEFTTVLGISKDSLNKLSIKEKTFLGTHLNRIDFIVEKIFKGRKIKRKLTIYTGLGNGDCGYPFKVGKEYIVFGTAKAYIGGFEDQSKKGIYWTSICENTILYAVKEAQRIAEKILKK